MVVLCFSQTCCVVQKRGGVHVRRGTHRLENVTSVTRQTYFHAHAEMAKQEKTVPLEAWQHFRKAFGFSLWFIRPSSRRSPRETARKTSQQPTSDKNVTSLNKGNSTRYWKEWQRLICATLPSCGNHRCKGTLPAATPKLLCRDEALHPQNKERAMKFFRS